MSLTYPESAKIFQKIRKSKSVLISCHNRADGDSIGSSLALASVIHSLEKKVEVVCSSEIAEEYLYLLDGGKIKIVDYRKFDFSNYDLYIIPDTSNVGRITGDKSFSLPKIFTIVIDNHNSNTEYGGINLIDTQTSSVCEMLFSILNDWDYKIDKEVATKLISGIYDDTGSFQHEVYKNTFKVTDELIRLGANYKIVVENQFHTHDLSEYKALGSVFNKIKIDKKYRFAHLSLNKKELSTIDNRMGLRELIATLYIRGLRNTDFGIVMFEEEKSKLSVSLRSRTGADISRIAIELGGGGHPGAAGAKIEAPFDEAVEKVLKTSRKFAKENVLRKS